MIITNILEYMKIWLCAVKREDAQIRNIIIPCLERLCFGITLHYSKSKGVSVIDNMGNIRSLSKEEAIYYNKVLQQRINLQM